ncbi:hypothetical protein ACJMK2_033899 [Sinanodonta woodiana]|uniref:Noggin n=1 Tax=Sinanodonta woodiana TaxID=1069815 RepID=A0ABD3WU29_SINWO
MMGFILLSSLLGSISCFEVLGEIPLTNNALPEPENAVTTIDKRQIAYPSFLNYKPTKDQMKLKKLVRRMGNDFNSNWMSIEKPSEHGHGSPDKPPVAEVVDRVLRDGIKRLNFTFTTNAGEVLHINNETVQAIKRWLIDKASCPIYFSWDDLGDLYWPRYIRRGNCDTGISCSWPEGMRCTPTEGTTLKVLRWVCKHRRKGLSGKEKSKKGSNHNRSRRFIRTKRLVSGKSKLKCKWTKIPYSVIDSCVCTC